jgi:SOS response associated peptidase (SRAP)
VPYWSKDPKKGVRPVNAKAETAHEKPMFRKLIRERRCLIPANCYYEWKEMPVGKRPYCIRMEDESPLFIGGMWDVMKLELEPRKSAGKGRDPAKGAVARSRCVGHRLLGVRVHGGRAGPARREAGDDGSRSPGAVPGAAGCGAGDPAGATLSLKAVIRHKGRFGALSFCPASEHSLRIRGGSQKCCSQLRRRRRGGEATRGRIGALFFSRRQMSSDIEHAFRTYKGKLEGVNVTQPT